MRLVSYLMAASLLLGSACGDDDGDGASLSDAAPQLDAATADAAPNIDGGTSLVARGEYLVHHVSVCVDCHTPRDVTGEPIEDQLLAGAECFIDIAPDDPDAGCLHTRNLTNHATGLANRTDEQIKNMFLNGVRPNGDALIPVMPYFSFHNMTEEDADAIVAYLRTVPGVDHAVPAHQAPWAVPAEPMPPINAADIPAPAPEDENYESALRGRYLAGMAGVCLECHTPETACEAPFCPLDLSKAFQGGRGFGIPSPPFTTGTAVSANITPHDPTGIGGQTVEQLKAAITMGEQADDTIICPPMPFPAFAGLTDSDVEDIINYLLSNTAVETEESPTCDIMPPPT